MPTEKRGRGRPKVMPEGARRVYIFLTQAEESHVRKLVETIRNGDNALRNGDNALRNGDE